jgi:hypothetical protein
MTEKEKLEKELKLLLERFKCPYPVLLDDIVTY